MGANTTLESNLTFSIRKQNMAYYSITFEDLEQRYSFYKSQSYSAARCDRFKLLACSSTFKKPSRYKVLNLVS